MNWRFFSDLHELIGMGGQLAARLVAFLTYSARGRGRKAKLVERTKTVLAVLAAFVALPAMALDKDDVIVREEDRVYRIHMAFDVPASIDQVKAVLTDFADPTRLNSNVTEREVLGEQDGIVRVRTEIRDCVVFFCKAMTLIQDVTVTADTVRADVVEDGGDFRHGFLRWSITATGNGDSHVVFDGVIEPGFFIPPLIGALIVRNALTQQVLSTAQSLVNEAPGETLTHGGAQ